MCAGQALLDQIDRLNQDPAVHGIIVQVPVLYCTSFSFGKIIPVSDSMAGA